jgi:hypothetical protein
LPHSVISEHFTINPETLAKQGISGQKGVNQNYDKSIIHLPRQECGVHGISWYSADTLGHSFTTAECETTIRLRMSNGKTTVLQQSLIE